MSKYTIQLRELFEPYVYNPPLYTREEVESWFMDYELSDYLNTKQIETIEANGLWNKSKLARKIVDHYYMEEIGADTPTLFKHNAKVKMQEIMEYYLPMIFSSSIDYDPLVNVDYTETLERSVDTTSNGTSTGLSNSTSNSDNLSIGSDTPQNRVTKQSILNGVYASSTNYHENEISDSTNTSSSSETTSGSDENYTKRVKGNSGVSATAQKMIEQYRNNVRNFTDEIIKDCKDLFMLIY